MSDLPDDLRDIRERVIHVVAREHLRHMRSTDDISLAVRVADALAAAELLADDESLTPADLTSHCARIEAAINAAGPAPLNQDRPGGWRRRWSSRAPGWAEGRRDDTRAGSHPDQ